MPWQKQINWLAADGINNTTGINNALLSATTNSNWIDVRSAGQATIEVDIVNATGAALPVVFTLQTKRSGEALTVGTGRDLVITNAAAPVSGVVTQSVYTQKWSITTPALAGTYRKTLPIPLNDEYLGIVGVTASGAGVGDLVSITVRVGY